MAWLRVSQNNKVKFLKFLDVEEEPKLMGMILNVIFRLSQSDQEIEELIQVSGFPSEEIRAYRLHKFKKSVVRLSSLKILASVSCHLSFMVHGCGLLDIDY